MERYEYELNYGDEAALNILAFNESGLAEIIDFSESGATCQIFTSEAARAFERHGVNLFNCLAGLYLRGLPCRVRYSIRVSGDKPKQNSKRIYHLEFPDLSDQQQKALNDFIDNGYQYFTAYDNQEH